MRSSSLAAFNAAMAGSDVVLVGTLAKGIAKGAWKKAPHDSKAMRKWITDTGRAEYPGQPSHHAFLQQNQGIGKHIPDVIKNQPYNLVGIPKLPGIHPATLHNSIHGWGQLKHQRLRNTLKYGIPNWAKAVAASAGGRISNGIRNFTDGDKDHCDC